MPTYNAQPGELVFVNSEQGPEPWTINFPADVDNNTRVWVVDTSETAPATPISYDFNGANYFHGRLDPPSGQAIDIAQPGASWQWVFNEDGNFWYPLDAGQIDTSPGPTTP